MTTVELKKILAKHARWLRGAGGARADLSRADLSRAVLSGADLRGADLTGADLSGADLSGADLRGADLTGADLSRAVLTGAVLSGASGVLDASDWLRENFESDDQGVIVYRAQRGLFDPPESWRFELGAVLTEVPNPDRGTLCACGVNFATREWIEAEHPGQPIWRCRINWRDLPGVVVPFGTDGKARCSRLELIEVVGDAA